MAKVISINGEEIEIPNIEEENTTPKRDYLEEAKGFIYIHDHILNNLWDMEGDKLTAEVLDKGEIDMATVLNSANNTLLHFFLEEIKKANKDLKASNDGKRVTDDNKFNLAYLRQVTLYIALSSALPHFMQGKEDEIRKYDKMVDENRKRLIKLVSNK